MTIKQWKDLLEEVYDFLDARKYDEATELAKKLAKEAKKNKWQQQLTNSLEILLAIAIETNDVTAANKQVKELAKYPPTAYSIFLKARELLLRKDNAGALKMGRKALAFAISHKDTTPIVIMEKIYNLLAKLLSNYGEHSDSLKYYREAVNAADSRELKALEYSNYVFTYHFLHISPQEVFQAHLGYSDLFKDVPRYEHKEKYRLESICNKPAGKIRVGYISPDLRYHVVLRFCWAMFTNYDKDYFEVYCYHNNPNEDKYSDEIKAMTDCWRNISGMNAQAAAELIYHDKVDILVDLAGHTKNNSLPVLAYKPAPVQISGIGYFATTGLNTVDYFLSDKYLASERGFFSEDIIELEHSHFCYAAIGEIVDVGEAPCKKNKYITFGSFNHLRKVNDEVLKLWTDIIKAVPASHLLLKSEVFDDEYGHKLFCERLKKFGIDINSDEWKKRIELRGFSLDYLKDYLDMDIALDTFPYPGGGTTCDALYMGIPVITIKGENHGERFGYSLLNNIGLPEFVVDNKQAYYDLAVGLANDQEIINNLHIGLRNMMEKSPLMDRKLYMQELEAAYKNVWRKYIASLPKAVCPTAKEALNDSFDCYKAKDYGRAEEWCRLAMANDRNGKYLLEGTSLLSNILQEKLDYKASWQASIDAVKLLASEKEKGTIEFQRRLWINYASRGYKLGFIDEAVAGYYKAAELSADNYGKIRELGSALLTLLCRTEDCEEVRQRLEEINEVMTSSVSLPAATFSKGEESEKAFPKIHLAYISPDFRQHVMFSFYYILLHGYDREKFRVTCISLTDKQDGFTEHLKGLVDNWIDAACLSLRKLSSRLKKENIDILVDLAGHSVNSGLPIFYDSIARVQISGLGWMESTGLSCVDYLITDRYIDPDKNNITEQPLYLTSQFCYTGRNDVRVPQGAPCKEKGYVTFGVFNHYHKWTDEMLLAWKEIMERVPASRLLLKCQLLVSESACDMVRERLQALGLDLNRIEMEAATNTYMNRYLDVDIALDTYPYPGGGTTCDALYMGVPVVSRFGQRRGSRFGLSILSNTGLGELAVSNINDYIDRAVGLAADYELLDMLHKNLRKMMSASPIMDGKKYMAELEAAYTDILAGK